MAGRIQKTQFEKMVSPLGSGVWVDKTYILHACPFCQEALSFQFTGATGIWRCVSCNEFGGSFEELEHRLNVRFVPIDQTITDPGAPEGAIVVSEYKRPATFLQIDTGILEVDQTLGGLTEGALTILSGKQAEGKSTLSGQLALNAIQQGNGVCFYSGELSAAAFQRWILSQAAGPDFCKGYADKYGKTRFEADINIVPTINAWLGKKLVLYDNSVAGSSEMQSIMSVFKNVLKYYGTDLFIVDNLMTVRQNVASHENYMLAQSRFVGELIDFAQQGRVHVILVAHPRKGDDGDYNDRVSGIGDITRRSSNVMFIERLTVEEQRKMLREGDILSDRTSNLLRVTKGREYGDQAIIELTFDKKSRRLVPSLDPEVTRYGWEDLM